jgi:hypothetical protein
MQLSARTHPSIINTHRFLLSLWHASPSSSKVSLTTPISYFDRFRIRLPGDATFTLGPHIDGGGIERWEDGGFRKWYGNVSGGRWKEHDPWDAEKRVSVKGDLYNALFVVDFYFLPPIRHRPFSLSLLFMQQPMFHLPRLARLDVPLQHISK